MRQLASGLRIVQECLLFDSPKHLIIKDMIYIKRLRISSSTLVDWLRFTV